MLNELPEPPKDIDDVRSCVRGILKRVEEILVSGATSPTDFTLHDAGHAFRVSELMCKVIPPDVLRQLSHYELALLLLSAYLHDIGMTPERSRERAVYSFIATGETTTLSEPDSQQLQRWLDDEPDGSAVPVLKEKPTAEQIALVEQLTAHYIRDRHNDWSTDWIGRELRDASLGTYAGWLHDLIALCDSHHRGYSRLAEDRFDARLVGVSGEVVHLRYLAAVLRIADVLEFDPERTPDVVFHHRLVSEKSQIFWAKDHQIAPEIEPDRIHLSARPGSAALHRAIVEMIDQIDAELRTCRKLADEKHFDRGINLTELPHRWDLPATVNRDIRPREGTYEYIEGGFRPNTKKLLELLAGNQFYGHESLIAVRELLQNAFDALREEIAVERLRLESSSDRAWESKLGAQHCVTMHLEQCGPNEDRRWWLVCADDGVGMTKDIIEKHLLVSGNARRREVLSLRRRCSDAGFNLARSGQFGIGVLAYFMLADRVVISTRRSDAHDDGEQTGWRFETGGVGSFGELRKRSIKRHGSEVALRLKPDIAGDDIAPFFSSLREFLCKLLIRIPCRFILKAPNQDLDGLDRPSGWFRTKEEIATDLLSGLRVESLFATKPLPKELMPSAVREKRAARDEHLEQVRREARDSLRWFSAQEGELPDGLGCYRILVPYFELADGACAGFLRIRAAGDRKQLLPIDQGHIFVPEFSENQAWCGFRAHIGRVKPSLSRELTLALDFSTKGAIASVEVALENSRACNISVDRHALGVSPYAAESLAWLSRHVTEFQSDCFIEVAGGYGAVNASICPRMPPPARYNWVRSYDPTSQAAETWGPVSFPAISSNLFKYDSMPDFDLRWAKKPVHVVPSLRPPGRNRHWQGLSWPPASCPPDLVAALALTPACPVPVWVGPADGSRPEHPLGWTCAFPPAWRHICTVVVNDQQAWNQDHPLVRRVDAAALEWLSETGDKAPQMALDQSFRKDVLKSPSRAAAWLARMLASEYLEAWRALAERDRDFLDPLWSKAFGDKRVSHSHKPQPLVTWRIHGARAHLHKVTPDDWREEELEFGARLGELHPLLPDPGPDWTIEVIPSESDVTRRPRAATAAAQKRAPAKPPAKRGARSGASSQRKKTKRAPKRPKRPKR